MIANPVPCGLATCRRCGARCKRTGLPCKQPAMPNGRCKLHGGKSPGAPMFCCPPCRNLCKASRPF